MVNIYLLLTSLFVTQDNYLHVCHTQNIKALVRIFLGKDYSSFYFGFFIKKKKIYLEAVDEDD